MVWVKSLLGGTLAAITGGCIWLVVILIRLRIEAHSHTVGVDASVLRDPRLIVLLLVLFVAGFAISFYRLK